MHWGTSFFSTALPRRWAQSLFGLAHSLLVWLAERQCVSAWKGLEGLLVSSPAHSLSRRRDGSNQCCECFDTHSLQIGCWHLHTSENLLNLPTSARLRATERTEISHLREWPDRAPAEAPTARCQRAEDALSNPSRLWIMKFKQLQHWLCENLPRFSAVTFFTLQKRTQRFPESEWQDLSPASKLPRGFRNNYYTKFWGYNWTDFFEDVLAFALCDSNGIVRGSRCDGWVGYCGVSCRFCARRRALLCLLPSFVIDAHL